MRSPRFSKSQFKRLEQQSKQAATLNGCEVCGLILDNGLFLELIQLRNKTRRGGGFSFYFGEVRAARKWACLCHHEIVGTFHSHPVGAPSPGSSDLCNAVDDSFMLIFDVVGRAARLWHVKNGQAKLLRFSLL